MENWGRKSEQTCATKSFRLKFQKLLSAFAAFTVVPSSKPKTGSSAHTIPPPPLPFPSVLFCSSLICYSSPPKCICVHAERLCIFCVRFDVLMTTWRANYSQRFPPLFSFCHFFGFQQLHLAFPDVTALTASRTGYDRTTHTELNKKQQAWKNLFHLSKCLSQFELCIPKLVLYLDLMKPC